MSALHLGWLCVQPKVLHVLVPKFCKWSFSIVGHICDRIWEDRACRNACAIIFFVAYGYNIAKLVFVELW